MRRLPMTWGWMSKRPVPPEVMDAWFRPLWTFPDIRRDLRKYVLGVPPGGGAAALGRAAARLRPARAGGVGLRGQGDAPGTRPQAGRTCCRRADLVEIQDSYTLIPVDQPHRLAALMRSFILEDTVPNQ